MKKKLKSILCLALAMTMLFGSVMCVEAEEGYPYLLIYEGENKGLYMAKPYYLNPTLLETDGVVSEDRILKAGEEIGVEIDASFDSKYVKIDIDGVMKLEKKFDIGQLL